MYPLIEIFGLKLVSYSLFAYLAALLAGGLAFRSLGRLGLSIGKRLLLLITMALAFLIGARGLNILVNPNNYRSPGDYFVLRLFGLSLYGGIAGAFLALIFFIRLWKLDLAKILDLLVLPSGIAFIIARIGCFLNGCCAGKATRSPLGMVFPAKAGYQNQLAQLLPFKPNFHLHPTQLYELFGVLLGMVIISLLVKKIRLQDGSFFLLFGISFSLVRLLVLPLRALNYRPFMKNYFYPGLYLFLIVLGLVLFIRKEIGAKKKKEKI